MEELNKRGRVFNESDIPAMTKRVYARLQHALDVKELRSLFLPMLNELQSVEEHDPAKNEMRQQYCSNIVKPILCRAAVAWEVDKPFVIETIEVAPPKANEVRIKITHSSICRTDLGALTKPSIWTKFPIVLGHEAAGVVESIGEGVTTVKPGDHVIPVFLPQCKECYACKKNKTNLCDAYTKPEAKAAQNIPYTMRDGTTRFTCKGQPVYQFFATSTFSEYSVVPEIQVAKINPEAPLDKVCLIGCGIGTGYGSAVNTARVEKGSTCAVWGLGAVGLAAVMGCRNAGASRIIGIDTNPDKFPLAKKFGMTEGMNPNDYDKPIQEVLIDLTDGGLDHTLECIGNNNTMRAALESTRKGWGISVAVGVYWHDISTHAFQLLSGRTWTGALYGDWKSRDDVPKLVESYMKKEILVDEFITHRMTLDKINEAFDLLKAGEW
ncbi:hypothetical protein FSP39_012571 [Pinctada imbricata]|uniref:Alcohol dehydrogenase 6 n=1 Tax=Pinctada imbricata TaxID=66713 RepID=A0AA88XM81_PINIB|nr:hypothetical protein FSP39_012571 [Pinctada imbricata]